MRPHHELRVWQDAMALVRKVYEVSAVFPPDERFGLTAQIRRSAVSVPSNIAEEAAHSSQKEFLRFLSMARGSLSELDTQLRIAHDLRFADTSDLIRSIESLFAMLAGLMRMPRSPSQSAARTNSLQAAQPPTYEPAKRAT